jgi:hypothetical protein
MPTEERLANIEQAIGGPDGLNVRVARVETELAAHRSTSKAQHEQILAALGALPKASPAPTLVPAEPGVHIDPKTVAAIVSAIILAIATALVGHQVSQSAVTSIIQAADPPVEHR